MERMSLKEQLAARSAELVRRERVTLPMAGLEVQVRGLMAGEARRSGSHARTEDVQIALSTEDPATGKPIWNANVLEDLDAIAALHTADQATIIKKGNELSGMDELVKLFSPQTENGSSSSPAPSGARSGSSGRPSAKKR